jgi:arylsulfatase A-like enzyme
MTKNNDLKILVFSWFTGLFLFTNFTSCTNQAIENKPNLIVILTDDQGYSDIGCYGAKDFSTPNIDKMAEEGIRFTSFYAAPTCSPARASLLTGCYYQRVGIGKPLNGPTTGLHPNEITIAEHLKQNGYTTALIGKWHLGLPDEMSPVAQGFDYFSGIPLSHIRRGITEHTDGPTAYYKRQWKKMGVGIEREIEYAPDETLFTRRCTEEATNFIQKNRENPFFLYLAHPQVHKEVLSSAEFAGRTKRGRYGDSVEELDWSVGEVLKTLRESGIEKNTLVVFASDNGPWLGQGEQSGTASPLRAGKFTTWEGGVRVPCIMKFPGKIPEGIESDEVVSIMDIFPTFSKIIGTKMPTDRIIDGKNMLPVMNGQETTSPHQAYFYYQQGSLNGVRSGKWKLHFSGGKWELYNLKDDISEKKDVGRENPEIVGQLEKLLKEARIDMGDNRTGQVGKNARPLGVLEEL